MEIFHILNGDALKGQFPKQIEGTLIVLRECLIEGNIQGNSLSEFLQNRHKFLKEAYGVEKREFENKVEAEINKILTISAGATVYLWFEEDLFCQTNLWFTAHLIHSHTTIDKVHLILPTTNLEKGFGGMKESALLAAYHSKHNLPSNQLKILEQLWSYYQTHQLKAMEQLAHKHSATLPFLLPAVQAHIDRQSDGTTIGYPKQFLLQLKEEFPNLAFPAIFKKFSQQAAIYGFGDSQVYRIWEELSSG